MTRARKRLAWRPLAPARQRLPARRSLLATLLGFLLGARPKPSPKGSTE